MNEGQGGPVMKHARRSGTRAIGMLMGVLLAGSCEGSVNSGNGADATPTPPFTGKTGTIMFVTQVPAAFFGAVTSPFGNQQASVAAAPRGGDLMIRYPDGTIRNLTREAGFGNTGPQG